MLTAGTAGLHVITLGASDMAERVFQDALPTLEPLVLSGKAVVSRVAAADALGMLCFVASEGAHETLPIMALFSRVFINGEKILLQMMCVSRLDTMQACARWFMAAICRESAAVVS